MGFPCGSAGKDSICNVGDLGLIPWLGRFPWRREQQRMRWLDGITDLMDMSGGGDRQGDLVCCNSWGCKESDMTEKLN